MNPVIPSEEEVEEEADDDEGKDSPKTRQEVVTVFCVIPSIRTDGAFGGSRFGREGREEKGHGRKSCERERRLRKNGEKKKEW